MSLVVMAKRDGNDEVRLRSRPGGGAADERPSPRPASPA
jgi:hypothetical protein